MATAGTALVDPHVVFEKAALAPGMRVADLGCGRTGHFVFPASRLLGDQGIVYAVDVVKNILESVQSRCRSEGYNNVQTIWSDIEMVGKTPIPPESLDVCFVVNVLFLTKDRAGTIAEASRLLKAGGRLAIVEWRKPLGLVGPEAGRMIAPESIMGWAREQALTLLEQFELGDYHYCVILKK